MSDPALKGWSKSFDLSMFKFDRLFDEDKDS